MLLAGAAEECAGVLPPNGSLDAAHGPPPVAATCLDRESLLVGALSEMGSLWQDAELLKSALGYYRLMAAWMLRMASLVAAMCLGPAECVLRWDLYGRMRRC